MASVPILNSLRTRESPTWTGSWICGILAGETFWILGLFHCRQDLWWPGTASRTAHWIFANSIALYGLLGGIVGLGFCGLLRLVARFQRHRVSAETHLSSWHLGVGLQLLVAWIYLALETQRRVAGMPLASHARWTPLIGPTILTFVLWLITARLFLRHLPVTEPRVSILGARAAISSGLILVLITGCANHALRLRPPLVPASQDAPSTVLLVGLDGATLRILNPMFVAGQLPTLRKFQESGVWGSVLTYGKAASPLVWTSIATGKRVRDHGISDFVVREEGAYRPQPSRSSNRTAATLWQMLGVHHLRVAIVDWLVSFPPEPVNGEIVTHLQHPRGSHSLPLQLDTLLTNQLPQLAPKAALIEEYSAVHIDRVFGAASLMLRDGPVNLLALYEADTDKVQHLRWRSHDPSAFPTDRWDDVLPEQDFSASISQVYRQIDTRLTSLLELLPPDTLVMVVSDHGLQPQGYPRVRVHFDQLLIELGFGSSGRWNSTPQSFEAYALPQTPGQRSFGINLNIRGREQQGFMEPEMAEGKQEEILEALDSIRFESGGSPFGRVLKHPITNDPQPDITVSHSLRSLHPKPNEEALRLPTGKLIPFSTLFEVDDTLTGDHDYQGVLGLLGPGVRQGYIGPRVSATALQEAVWRTTDRFLATDLVLPWLRRLGLVERASTLDITPTLLKIFGLPPGADMSGRVLEELIDGYPDLSTIPSWEPLIDSSDSQVPIEEEDPETIERLRNLGYLN